MAAVQGLIVSDVNFNFSCFVHNHRFCKSGVLMFLHHRKTPRPIKIWSPGHFEGAKNAQHREGIRSKIRTESRARERLPTVARVIQGNPGV